MTITRCDVCGNDYAVVRLDVHGCMEVDAAVVRVERDQGSRPTRRRPIPSVDVGGSADEERRRQSTG
jgi:hypothetical protein